MPQLSNDEDRLLWRSSVFAVLRDNAGAVLLQRRQGTDYLAGWYDLPAGHVEPGESLISATRREVLEETAVDVDSADMELIHISQFDAQDEHYYNFIFAAKKWQGSPRIVEPHKCDDMQFFALDALPSKLTPATKVALDMLQQPPVSFGYIDQATYDKIIEMGAS